MLIAGEILFWIGMLMGLGGGLWLIGIAFQESTLWGLGCLFLPVVSPVFAILFWSQAKKPFLMSIAGGCLALLGIMLIGHRLGDIH